MDLLSIYAEQLEKVLLVWIRISGIFMIAPVFSSRNIPGMVKLGFSGLLAFIIAPLVPLHSPTDSIIIYFLIIAGELLIGLLIGLLAQVIFAAIQLAGQLIDMQMGFFIVNVVDPEHGTQVPLIGNFKFLIALVVFLIVNGHHMVIQAIANSFIFLPIGTNIVDQYLIIFLVDTFSRLFITALQISAPTVGTLFVVSVALGIIARTVPQMNVFMVGMPAKILIGFAMIFLSMPLYVYLLGSLFSRNYHHMNNFLQTFR